MNEVLLPHRHRWPRKPFFKKWLWTMAGSCALGGLYSWRFEDHWLRIERREMPLAGLGEGLEGLRLVHVSDLHCSLIVRERYLRQCVEAINAESPDFVAITGDFVTGPKHYVRRAARVLSGLRPRVATVACLGNHDYGVVHPSGLGAIRGMADYVYQHLGHVDIFVMLNESRVFRHDGAAIQFVGLEDYWSDRWHPELAFETARPGLPTIVLCHNPDAAPRVARHGADWILAGHTHGRPRSGRRLRDAFAPTSLYGFDAGAYALPDGQSVYVNRGLGYGRRVNLNSRPEITVFTLRAL